MNAEEIDALRTLLGSLPIYAPLPRTPSLETRVQRLLAWVCSPRPEDFRRSVPAAWGDHDELITSVLVDLISELERQSCYLDALCTELRRDEMRDRIDDPFVLGLVATRG